MKTIDPAFVLDHYDALLIDAYGVLVDGTGPLPGAREFIAALDARKMPYAIVTNDASRLPETIAARLNSFGLPIPTERIVSSASLLIPYFAKAGLKDAPTVVLGPPDAETYVDRAGGVRVHPATAGSDTRVIVVCDVPQGSVVEALEQTIDAAMARIDSGQMLELILCNPDLIYPRSPGHYGITSGSMMLVLEEALKTRHASRLGDIKRLGKPYKDIFVEGARRTGGSKLALLGDQLMTDVQGALDYGIDAVLLGTGLTKVEPGTVLNPMPTYYLPELKPGAQYQS